MPSEVPSQPDYAYVLAVENRIRASWARVYDRVDVLWERMTGSVGPDIRPWNAAKAAAPVSEPSPFAIEPDALTGAHGLDSRGDLDALRRKVLGKRERRVDPAVQAAAAAAGKKRKMVVEGDDEDEGRSSMLGRRKQNKNKLPRKAETVCANGEDDGGDEFAGFSDDEEKTLTRQVHKKTASSRPPQPKPRLEQASEDEDPDVKTSVPQGLSAPSAASADMSASDRAELKKQRRKEAKKKRKQAAKLAKDS